MFLHLQRHPVSALPLALTAYKSNTAYTAHHGSGKQDITGVKSTADLSRMQTYVLNLPFTVCSWGKAVFPLDLSDLICEIGVRLVLAHLMLLQQASAVIFTYPMKINHRKSIGVSNYHCQLFQRTMGKLHVMSRKKWTVLHSSCSPSHLMGMLCQLRVGGILLF